jgi:peptidoglycan/LPS O-acetylase OafA/YrhL
MGALRFYLAFSVAFCHVGAIFPGVVLGPYAVQIFFIISGFLITMVLHEKYGLEDIGQFYRARALRIYVPYLAVWASALLLGWSLGAPFVDGFLEAKDALASFYSFLTNVLILGQDWGLWLGYDGQLFLTEQFYTSPVAVWRWQVIPPAWSVSLEIMFYLIAPYVVRRSVWTIAGILMVSLTARAILYHSGHSLDPWSYRFFPFELALFLSGALSYRWLRMLRSAEAISLRRAAAVTMVIFLLVGLSYWLSGSSWLIFPVYGLVALGMPFLLKLNQHWTWDRYIGNLSYPVYLVHWPIQGLVETLAGGLTFGTKVALSMVSTLAVAWVVHEFVERPAERLRQARSSRLAAIRAA